MNNLMCRRQRSFRVLDHAWLIFARLSRHGLDDFGEEQERGMRKHIGEQKHGIDLLGWG